MLQLPEVSKVKTLPCQKKSSNVYVSVQQEKSKNAIIEIMELNEN
jgi:hypothetical protein